MKNIKYLLIGFIIHLNITAAQEVMDTCEATVVDSSGTYSSLVKFLKNGTALSARLDISVDGEWDEVLGADIEKVVMEEFFVSNKGLSIEDIDSDELEELNDGEQIVAWLNISKRLFPNSYKMKLDLKEVSKVRIYKFADENLFIPSTGIIYAYDSKGIQIGKFMDRLPDSGYLGIPCRELSK
jgi:hypothetical protein